MPLAQLPDRFPLGFLPTPLHPLKRLSRELGPTEIWIKRDDHTGLALGGNKTRKLEFLIAEAIAQQCDCVITAGAAQSNHCRQTAAAAAAAGLACHLVLGGEATPAAPNGNLLLDLLLGATIHWSGGQRKGELIPALAETLRSEGRNPFVIPYGGSNATGALGFVHAMQELSDQQRALDIAFDAIVFASSSGGTHAGFLVGRELTQSTTALIGIRIDKEDAPDMPFPDYILHLANQVAQRVNCPRRFHHEDLILPADYIGHGYGKIGPLEREAINLLARTEGILLDPVYTARAFGGMLDLLRHGTLKNARRILFWHTGGAPALFPYASDLFPA